MSDFENQGEISRETSLGGQIEMLCDRFEAAWKSGQRLKIEDCLGQLPEDQRAALLRELVAMEIELRQAAHEQPATEEYLTRFPQFGDEIAAAFTRTPSPAMAETVAQAEGSTPAPSPALHVRCPHCHNPVELLDDTPSAEIACNVCGSSFSLVGDEALAYRTIGGTRRRRQKIGRFELTEQVGSGAYGAVWKAHDSQLDRVVAVKTPRKGALTHEETEKILREARAAAQLRHPNIVSVHEVGLDGDLIYTVSDFVEGVSLQDWLTAQRFTHREAAGLCAKIADAIHFAHEHGVIHRDLKPSNIMLDGSGEPHIMDFGLARRESGEVTMTMEGQVLGTPAYMSPEQARGEGHSADRRTDVYSLGVIFFQLLTGEMPFRGNIRMLIKQVLEDPPPRPRKFDNRIPRDLETICLKCLEKNPARRYPSAQEVATELRRHLRGEPIRARPITPLGRTWRWCKRNPAVAVLGAALVVALVSLSIAGPAVALYQSFLRAEAERQERIAVALRLAGESRESLAADPERAVTLAVEALRTPLRHGEPPPPDGQAQKALRNALDSFREKSLRLCVGTSERVVRTGARFAVTRRVAISPDSRWLVTVSPDDQVRLWDTTARDPSAAARVLRGHTASIGRLEISPDSRWLVLATEHEVLLWDLKAQGPGSKAMVLREKAGAVAGVGISPDSRRLVCCYADAIYFWDLTSEQPSAFAFTLSVASGAEHLRFSGDGRWLITISAPEEQRVTREDGRITYGLRRFASLWDLRTRGTSEPVLREEISETYPQRGADMISISPDGRWVSLGVQGTALRLWDLTGRTPTSKEFSLEGIRDVTQVEHVRFSADGRWLVASPFGFKGEPLYCWDLTKISVRNTPTELNVVRSTSRRATDEAKISPDNRWLVTAGPPVNLWDLTAKETGLKPLLLPGETCLPPSAISPDSQWLLTYTLGQYPVKSMRLWNLAAKEPRAKGTPLQLDDEGYDPYRAQFSHDGRWLIADGSSTASAWDLKAKDPAAACFVLRGHEGEIRSATITPDSRRLVAWDDWTTRVCDLTADDPVAATRVLREYPHPSVIAAMSFDEQWLVANEADKTPELWDLTARNAAALPCRLHGHEAEVTAIAVSPDNRWLVTGSKDKTARLWDLTAEDPSAAPLVLPGHTDGILRVAISPDGRWLVTASSDKTARLWDLRADDPSAKSIILRGHAAGVYCLAISPDSHWLLTRSYDETALLWDLSAKDPAAATFVWRGRAASAPSATIEPSTFRLVASNDPTAALWNGPLGALRKAAELRAERLSAEEEVRIKKEQERIQSIAQERAESLAKRLPGARRLATNAVKASFSPDGTRIVFGKLSGSAGLQILDLNSGATTDLLPSGKDPAWSPGDGRLIAFVTGSGVEEIWLVEAGGANPRKLAEGTFPSWSSDGKTLFFHSPAQKKVQALRLDSDSPKPTDLCDIPTSVFSAVSPDGKRTAYAQGAGLHIIDNLTGKIAQVIALPTGGRYFLAWSPDGKQIGLGNYSGSNELGLWVVNLQRGTIVQVADGPFTMPAWSSDGFKLAFNLGISRASRSELWMVETRVLETLEPEAIRLEARAESLQGLPGARILAKSGGKASFSPDGMRVVFGKNPYDASGLRISDLKTGTTTDLLPFGKDPAWSPGDGRLIAFARGSGDQEEVWLVEAGGANPRKLTDGGFATWSPDAKSLYFHPHKVNKLQVMRVDAEGAKPTDVIDVTGWYPAVSPDGKQVAYRKGSQLVIADLKSGKTLKTWPLPGAGGFLSGWSPDGKQVAYGGYGEWEAVMFSIVNLDSGLALRFTTGGATMPAWSPDGSKMAFDVRLRGNHSEIWMIDTKVLEALKPQR